MAYRKRTEITHEVSESASEPAGMVRLLGTRAKFEEGFVSH